MNPFSLARRVLFRFGRPFRTGQRRAPSRFRHLSPQQLEERVNFAVDVAPIDGVGNNLLNPTWGSVGVDFLRLAPAEYADGVDDPAGADRPSAREISNALAAHPDGAVLNDRDLSAFIYAWGQFLDHDIDLTNTAVPAQSFNIAVPAGDPFFDPAGTGTKTISLNRSQTDSATGLGVGNPLQQVNSITAFIDGSQIYGSDAATAASLRTFSGGKLKTGDGNLLPTDENGNFLAGDIRVNENIELISMQTLFVREHNRLADKIAAADPTLNDEQIYQQARRTVVAELQAITYGEFLPALLGQQALKAYRGYNPNVNPGISNEFATAAFRFGHSMLGSDIEFLDNDGNEVREAVALREAFFNPGLLKETGIDSILKYLASDRAEELDTKVIDDVRNFLFGAPGQGGLDLASLNIQRGRDHGLADYNTMRKAYGLKPVKTFADITPDKDVQARLQQVYGSVDDIDAWVGGLAEKHVRGGSVGELFSRIIIDQFTRLRDGDRFWYQNTFSKAEVRELEHLSLADVIRNNTTVSNLQADVFFLRTSISGTVFNDVNRDGVENRGDRGLAGINVRLLDADGNLVQETKTDRQGNYRFTGLDLGAYRVEQQTPEGAKLTSAAGVEAQITRGMDIRDVDFGLTKLPPVRQQQGAGQGGQQGQRQAPPPPPPPAGNRQEAGGAQQMQMQQPENPQNEQAEQSPEQLARRGQLPPPPPPPPAQTTGGTETSTGTTVKPRQAPPPPPAGGQRTTTQTESGGASSVNEMENAGRPGPGPGAGPMRR